MRKLIDPLIFAVVCLLVVLVNSNNQEKKAHKLNSYVFSYPLILDVNFNSSIKAPLLKSGKIKIAVVDSPADMNHPVIKPFKSSTQIEIPQHLVTDHGTHVSGIIAQNLLDVFGADAPEFFEIENFPMIDPEYSIQSYITALQAAVNSNADIINISLSGDEMSFYENILINNALNRGVVVVVSAGNEGSSAPSYPCAYKGVTCVGNLNGVVLNPSSNYGANVKVFAQGTRIVSSLPYSSMGIMTGTSQAAPLVSAFYASKIKNPSVVSKFKNKVSFNSPLSSPNERRLSSIKD